MAVLPITFLGFIIKTPENTPLSLPASAVMFILPALVASFLVGRRGLKDLWSKVIDRRYLSHIRWYLFALLAMPIIAMLSYIILRLNDVDLGLAEVSIMSLAILCAAYTVSAICEEVGWMGYAFDPMDKRWGTVKASLMLGLFWALLHAAPWVQVHGIVWTLGWALFSVFIRIPMTLVYKKTGKTLPAVIVMHASINVVISLMPGFIDTVHAPYMFAGLCLLLCVGIFWIRTLKPDSMQSRT